MRPSYLIPLLAVMPVMAQTQPFTFGVKGGVPAQTPMLQTDRIPFVLGPTVDIRISSALSLETGILFHRMGQQSNTAVFPYPENAVTTMFSNERGRALELPVLARYRFLSEHRTWRPFLTAGPAVRRTSLDFRGLTSILSGTQLVNFTAQPVLNTKSVKWNVDPVVGAGLDFKAGRFHLEPEFRYSYWGAGRNSLVRKNQASFLLGFRF